MNYKLHYDRLIAKSQGREILEPADPLYVYYERHHIIPRCLGGDNKKSNIAILTPEEHYVAHQLLYRMHPNNRGLLFAAIRMTFSPNGQRMNNRLYAWLRRRLSEDNRILHKQKKIGMHGKRHTDETKEKMRISHPRLPGPKGKESPNFGLKRSKETREKISNARRGKPSVTSHSADTIQKMREKRKLQTRTSQKRVIVFGVEYNSVKESCDALGRTYKYIIHRLRSENFPDCYYL